MYQSMSKRLQECLHLVSYQVLTSVSPHDYCLTIDHSSPRLNYFTDRFVTH